MKAGQIVLVDWRDQLFGSREPNKRRPAIVVGSAPFLDAMNFAIVVPLTAEASLAVAGASLRLLPTAENGCTKPCHALSWCVQTVPYARITETPSRITNNDLREIRAQIAACVAAS